MQFGHLKRRDFITLVWREAQRLCCSKDGGFSQGFSKEIQEATQGKTLSS
jgi:hypothetical protein